MRTLHSISYSPYGARRTRRILIVGSVLIAASLATPAAQATFPGSNGKIAYAIADIAQALHDEVADRLREAMP